MAKIIGVDVGAEGAIVFLDNGKVTAMHVMPKIDKVLDLEAISDIFKRVPDRDEWYVFIEEVHAIFGVSAKATFSFGFAFCAVQMAACANRFKYALVQPKKWQQIAYQGIPELRKPSTTYTNMRGKFCTRRGGLKTKEMSLIAAKRLYPDVDLRASSRCKVPHKGIVDALLIADYGRFLNSPRHELPPLGTTPKRELPDILQPDYVE